MLPSGPQVSNGDCHQAGAQRPVTCDPGVRGEVRTGVPCGVPVPGGRSDPRPSAPLESVFGCLLAGFFGALIGCSEQAPPLAGARSGRHDRDAGVGDGGQTEAPSPRPDGPPRLPEADDSLELPFLGPAIEHTIEIDAAPRALDLVFDVDTTASMGGEIDELQESLIAQVAPELRKRVEDVSFAVARFEDFPHRPWGFAGSTGVYRADEPYRLLTPLTSDADEVASALASLDQSLGEGGDIDESGAEALWQIATGEGYSRGGDRVIASYAARAAEGGGDLPGVGFRRGTLRAVVHVTDAPSHDAADYAAVYPGTHDIDEAAVALHGAEVHALSILSSACADPDHDDSCDSAAYARARAQLVSLAVTTRALGDPEDDACPYGVGGRPIEPLAGRCPLVFEVASTGEGLSTALVDAVVALVDGTRFELVSAEATGDPIGFVRDVTPVEVEGGPMLRDDLPKGAHDGRLDSFVDVLSGRAVAFTVTLQNRVVPARDFAQRFRVVIEVRGDGVVLERRTLRVVVPAMLGLVPAESPPPDEDAGSAL